MRISGSLARKAIKELESKQLIKPIDKHGSLVIYTRATAAVVAEESQEDTKQKKKGKKGKKDDDADEE